MALNTERPKTAREMLEDLKTQKAGRKAAMESLNRTHIAKDKDTVLENTLNDIDNSNKNSLDPALEAMRLNKLKADTARNLISLEGRLLQEGLELVKNKVLFEMVYKAYWADDSVKNLQSTVTEAYGSFKTTMKVVHESCKDSEVDESKQNKLVKNINSVIEATCKKAAKRLAQEAKDKDLMNIDFDLSPDEEDELDGNLSDLGSDEIVDLIKTKVLTVVQDEQEAGKKKSELFQDLVDQSEDDEDDDTDESDADDYGDGDTEDDDTSTQEGVDVITEGAGTQTLKLFFSDARKNGSASCKEANKLYKQGKYAEAKKEYERTIEIFTSVKKKMVEIDDTVGATILSWTYFAQLAQMVVVFTDAINTRGGSAYGDLRDAQVETDTWNATRQYAIANCIKMIRFCNVRIASCERKMKSAVKESAYADFDAMIRQKNIRKFNNSTAGSLFESFMIANSNRIQNIIVSEGVTLEAEGVFTGALLESIFQYTVLETLNTIGLYEFKSSDVTKLKKTVIESLSAVEEGNEKTIRIHTRKMKNNHDDKIMSSNGAPVLIGNPSEE